MKILACAASRPGPHKIVLDRVPSLIWSDADTARVIIETGLSELLRLNGRYHLQISFTLQEIEQMQSAWRNSHTGALG